MRIPSEFHFHRDSVTWLGKIQTSKLNISETTDYLSNQKDVSHRFWSSFNWEQYKIETKFSAGIGTPSVVDFHRPFITRLSKIQVSKNISESTHYFPIQKTYPTDFDLVFIRKKIFKSYKGSYSSFTSRVSRE